MKQRENFDLEYQDAIINEKKLSISDELNILYVALTRAKNNMIIFKKQKSSVFEYLGDLDKIQLGEFYIDRQISEKINENKIVQYKPLSLGYQDIKKDDQEQSIQDLKARYFGIATHYCLEMMDKFDIKSLNFSINLVKSKYSEYLDEENFNDIYERIKLLVSHQQFLDFIKNSTYTKEQELIYNNELKIIDLLIEKQDYFIIMDYKTTQEQHLSHKKQVEQYKEAIKNITNGKVKSYLIYLHPNKINLIEV